MPSQTLPLSRKPKSKKMRQSVTIPAPLAAEVLRVAKERHLTASRALVTLAEQGIQAEREAREKLKGAYRKLMKEREPSKREEAGRELIRAIFGKDAIAEDTVR